MVALPFEVQKAVDTSGDLCYGVLIVLVDLALLDLDFLGHQNLSLNPTFLLNQLFIQIPSLLQLSLIDSIVLLQKGYFLIQDLLLSLLLGSFVFPIVSFFHQLQIFFKLEFIIVIQSIVLLNNLLFAAARKLQETLANDLPEFF